jgi:hypothetical protein
MLSDVTLWRFNGSTCRQAALRQLNSGSDNDGDGGAGKFDARYTRNIGCQSNNTSKAENKSSTAAGNTHKDNNCSTTDGHNNRPEIRN